MEYFTIKIFIMKKRAEEPKKNCLREPEPKLCFGDLAEAPFPSTYHRLEEIL
jgi:hypothetical protein